MTLVFSRSLLDPGATVTGDGGGLVSASLLPIEGGEQVARYLADLARQTPGNVRLLERTVNGQPGLVAQQDGVTLAVYAFEIAGARITRMWAVLNPGKLRPWAVGGRSLCSMVRSADSIVQGGPSTRISLCATDHQA